MYSQYLLYLPPNLSPYSLCLVNNCLLLSFSFLTCHFLLYGILFLVATLFLWLSLAFRHNSVKLNAGLGVSLIVLYKKSLTSKEHACLLEYTHEALPLFFFLSNSWN